MSHNSIITTFFSWQSDSDADCNQKAIKTALKQCLIEIEEKRENLSLNFDEATRNMTGSGNISNMIFHKISTCDIFICDITTINSEHTNLKRPTPNPNVLIELGYAIAVLGWDRIIMLFNKSFGKFPQDLPFDISGHRITDFQIKDKNDNNGKGLLKSVLKAAITDILEKNPLKPHEFNILTPEQNKRKRDTSNLLRILSAIHIPSLDLFLEEAPARFSGKIFHFWETFNGIFNDSLFYIYDETVKNLLSNVQDAWKRSLSFHQYYRPDRGNLYIFDYLSVHNNAAFNLALEAIKDLKKYSTELFNHIREYYLEINLEETNKHAFEEFHKFNKPLLGD